jgi:REP element-mobilizing transposase RayT
MMGTRYHPGVAVYPYFVTAVTKGRRPILGDPRAADLLVSELGQLRDEIGFLLLAYALMPDHIHLVVVPGPSTSLSGIMQSLKGRFARHWNQRLGRRGSVWQPRYYESAVRTEAQLIRWLEYVAHNPVQAGLAKSPEEYPYCSPGGKLATDLEAYLDGSRTGRAEARPSEG